MTTQPPLAPRQPVVITDIDIPFWRLVFIFVKWALAAIPATIVLVVIWMIVAAVLAAVFGIGGMMRM
jgi:hypothetical protein